MVDCLGQELRPGQYITYAANDGRCGVLRIGRVLRIVTNDDGNETIRVAACELRGKWEDRTYKKWLHQWKRFGKKEIVLGMPERTIVLPDDLIPGDLIELLA